MPPRGGRKTGKRAAAKEEPELTVATTQDDDQELEDTQEKPIATPRSISQATPRSTNEFSYPPPTPAARSSSPPNKSVFSMIALAAAVCLGVYLFPNRSPTPDIYSNNLTAKISSIWSGGDPNAKEYLVSELTAHMENGDPTHPACIIAASRDQSANLLTEKLSSVLYADPRASLSLAGKAFSNWNEMEAMRAIEANLSAHFASRSVAGVFISDIDKIHPTDATKLLWLLCDDDAAPYKNAIFVFSAQISSLPTCGTTTDGAREIKNYFRGLWTYEPFEAFWIRVARLSLLVSDSSC